MQLKIKYYNSNIVTQADLLNTFQITHPINNSNVYIKISPHAIPSSKRHSVYSFC